MENNTELRQLLVTECRDHSITRDKLEETEKELAIYRAQAYAWYDAYQKLLTSGQAIPLRKQIFRYLFPT